MADIDVEQLSPSQQEALQQYMGVTDQDIKDAVPLLERSQWNVQVDFLLLSMALMNRITDAEPPDCHFQILRWRGT